MNRSGHYGLALLGCTLAFVVPGWLDATLSAVGIVTAMVCCQFPDIDHRTTLLKQRGITHTLLSALLFASAVGVVFWYAGTHVTAAPLQAAVAGGFGAFVGYTSHLVGDMLTIRGIKPLWPASSRRIAFKVVVARSERANNILLMLGAVTFALFAIR